MREKKHHVWANSHNSQVRCASCIRIIGISARRGNAAEEFRISRECVAAPWVAQSPQPAATKNGGDGFSLPIKTKIWVPGTSTQMQVMDSTTSGYIQISIERLYLLVEDRWFLCREKRMSVDMRRYRVWVFLFTDVASPAFGGGGWSQNITSFWLTHEKKMKINWSWEIPSF